MQTSKYSDRLIMSMLKQAKASIAVPNLCREHAMSSTIFHTDMDLVINDTT